MLGRGMMMAVIGCALAAPSLAWAQDNGNRRDPAQMRERMMNGIKERLGTNDDEWKVVQPKLEKLMTVQRDSRGGGFGGGRRGGGGGDEQPTTPVGIASADLRKTLDNKDAPADEIAGKLKALRDAREKAKGELTAAQKELKEVLTARQEAVLVTMGMLE